jgi:pimeloyl-ACP methyl ester carboxylesterase
VDRVDIVGASIGDLWALRFAQAEPERVRRIVLLGGGPLTSAIEVPPFIKLLRSPLGRIIVALPEKPGMLRKQMTKVGHDDGVIPAAFIRWHVEMSRTTDWPRHEREMVRAVVRKDGFTPRLVLSDEDMAAIRQPVLMVYGSDDPNGSVAIWQRFTAGLPAGPARGR